MACSYCGQQYCSGGCLSAQGQIVIQNPTFVGGGGAGVAGGQGFILAGYGGGGGGLTPTLDTALHNFLEVIADKDDTAACVAFLEKQLALHIKQRQEIERLQKQYESDLERAEQEFLSKCQKYRPSITEELLKRIKGLKAFF